MVRPRLRRAGAARWPPAVDTRRATQPARPLPRPRIIWRGAITFGLVHIPVVLYPATRAHALDLDLIDRRDYAPVGYRHYNKTTGKDVARRDIVKGYAVPQGRVRGALSDEDFPPRQSRKPRRRWRSVPFCRPAPFPRRTTTRPYYLEPDKRGDKGYALLRAAMREDGRVALATLVVRNRQHFAAIAADGDVLLLTTLRYADEIRPASALRTPSTRLSALGVTAREVANGSAVDRGHGRGVAAAGIQGHLSRRSPARIRRKVRAGRMHAVSEPEPDAAPAPATAEVIDLVAMLKKSLRGGKGASTAAPARASRRARHARPHRARRERRSA